MKFAYLLVNYIILSHTQLIKNLASSVLIVHGKLYTKIGYVVLSSDHQCFSVLQFRNSHRCC